MHSVKLTNVDELELYKKKKMRLLTLINNPIFRVTNYKLSHYQNETIYYINN